MSRQFSIRDRAMAATIVHVGPVKACPKGHLTARVGYYLKNNRCKRCKDEWRAASRDRINELARRNRNSEADRVRQERWKAGKGAGYHRRYYEKKLEEDPTYYVRKRHARRRLEARQGSYSRAEWESVLATHGDRCLRCGDAKITIDHVVPLSKGGSNTVENLQPLCGPCNKSKGTNTRDYRNVETV